MTVYPFTVVVGTGTSEQQFFIHSSVLEKSSDFFKAALKPQWFRSAPREVKLPEEDPNTFIVYANWLYSGAMSMRGCMELARLYVLGEKLIDPTFQDMVINAIVAKSRKPDVNGKKWDPGRAPISVLYRNTPEGSPARRLMVNFYTTHGQPKRMSESSTVFTKEFLFDLATAFLNLKVKSNHDEEARKQINTGAPCAYHKHAVENPCREEVVARYLED